jgi:hypothetical protein
MMLKGSKLSQNRKAKKEISYFESYKANIVDRLSSDIL